MRTNRILKSLLHFYLFALLFVTFLSPFTTSADSTQPVVAKPLVILMEFDDYKFSEIDEREDSRIRKISGDEFPTKVNDILFSKNVYEEGGQSYLSIRSYFNQMTYGTFDFDGEVVGPYEAEHPASYYGNNEWPGGDQEGARFLIAEAIESAAQDPNVDLSNFDVETRIRDRDNYKTEVTYNRPDGQVDTVIVIHPGIGEEFGGGSLGSDAIWPFRRGFTWYGGEYGLKEYVTEDHNGDEWRFDDFAVVAQDSAPDLLIHEFGHIMGLPDLYGAGDPPVGYWDIMSGSYTGEYIYGTMPIAYGAYSRLFLQQAFKDGEAPQVQWTTNKTIDFDTIGPDGIEIELHQAHDRLTDKYDAVKIELPDTFHEQYYILEWRNPVSNQVDEGLTHINPYWPQIQYDPGLIIWHIDETFLDEWNRPDQSALEPGKVFAGVVDADQRPIYYYKDGKKHTEDRSDFLLHDAAFSLRNGEEFFHSWGEDFYTIDEHLSMIPIFDDSLDYSNPTYPNAGLDLHEVGLKVLVLEENTDRSIGKIRIMNQNLENYPADYSTGLSIKSISLENNIISVVAENDGSQRNLSENATITFIDENDSLLENTVELSKDGDVYKGNLSEASDLTVSHVILEDLEGNVKAIYNADLHSGYGVSFSALWGEQPDLEDPDEEDPETEDPDEEDPETEDPDEEVPVEDPEKDDPKMEDPITDERDQEDPHKKEPVIENGTNGGKGQDDAKAGPKNSEKSEETPSKGGRLPNTATNTFNIILIGFALFTVGAILMYKRRKVVN